MKKFIAIVVAVVIVLLLACPVLAASLGISPSHTELEVPADGSATANFKVHYFTGDIKVSLVDIPLKVEPETLHIEPSSEPVEIELTIYGDQSLGSRVYDGYVRFLGMSGGTVGVAVKVKASVTNLVEGETPVLAAPEQPQLVPEGTPPAPSAPPGPPAPPLGPPPAPPGQGGIAALPLNTVIIIAGGFVFLGLIVLSIVLVFRRARY